MKYNVIQKIIYPYIIFCVISDIKIHKLQI